MNCLSSFGMRSLLDSNSDFFDAGLPVYYRTANFDAVSVGQGIDEMGFQVVPAISGVSGMWTTGTKDYMICPQPSVKLLTMKQLADGLASGYSLRTGARTFNISHSWVQKIQTKMLYSNPRQVFNNPHVVGFYHDGLLFQIVSFVHNDMYGGIIDWDIICNANEIK